MILAAIISDDSALKRDISLILGETFVFVETEGGPEALLDKPVGVLFLDSPLKGRDPLEILRQVNRIKPGSATVLLTADPRLGEEAGRLGAYDVLPKPIEPERLKTVAAHALERGLLLREKTYLERQFQDTAGRQALPPPAPEQGRDFHSEALRRVSEALLRIFDDRDFVESMVRTIGEVFGLSRVALFLRDGEAYRVRASFGWDRSWAEKVSFPPAEGLPAWLEREQRILDRDQSGSRGLPGPDSRLENDLEIARARVCVPVFSRGRVSGFLALGNRISGRPFGAQDMDFFSFLANYFGLVIENAALYRQAFLKKKEQEMILEHLTAGVVAVNPEGRITSYNQKALELLSVGQEELKDAGIQKAGSQMADFVWRALRKKELVQDERVVYAATGKPVQVSTNLIRDENDAVAGAVLIFSDLAVFEELRKKVEYLERLNFWYKLASSMAHQIKNPLVAIKTFIQLLPDKYQDQEFRENFRRIVSEEVERLNRIASDLFEFSEPVEMHLAPVPLREVIESSAGRFLREGGHAVEVARECPESVVVEVDRRRLERAFDCILANAGEAIRPPGGRIGIKAQEADEGGRLFVRVDVEDTGAGIKPEDLADVFSPFYTTKNKGMGLGLPVAQRIIEDHGGRIKLESVPRKGTLCRIWLPIKRGEAQ